MNTHGAWVTEFDASADKLRAFAFWLGNGWVDHYEYAIKGTPCEGVIYGCRAVHVPDNVIALYPDDPDLRPVGAVSYLGVPLVEAKGNVIGNLAVLDRRPMPEEPRALAIIQIFAARAGAEVSRLRAERALRAREEQVRGLVDSALDAIVQLDAELRIVRANPAAAKTFRARPRGFLADPSASSSPATRPPSSVATWRPWTPRRPAGGRSGSPGDWRRTAPTALPSRRRRRSPGSRPGPTAS